MEYSRYELNIKKKETQNTMTIFREQITSVSKLLDADPNNAALIDKYKNLINAYDKWNNYMDYLDSLK